MVSSREAEKRTPTDWDEIHQEVQTVLAGMVDPIRQAVPNLYTKAGRTQAPTCPLFTYREFTLAGGQDLEAVIVGVTFSSSENGTAVRGDIGGEETGCTYFETGESRVSDGGLSALAAAIETANQLGNQTDVVVKALTEALK